MSTLIYDKTDKGREEIATRKYQLASRIRTLLVMVDGKQTEDDLLKKVAGLGLGQQNIDDLIEQQFIAAVTAAPAAATAPRAPSVNSSPPENTAAATAPLAPMEDNGPDSVLGLGAGPETELDEAARFQAVYNFFNETIKSTLGLRGFTLQMKVERAATLEDFRELRRPYLEAIQKAKGNEMARSLRDRLDQLLVRPGEKLPTDTTLLGS
ncbi:hypothetical protein [Undibacterium terreum]|uniref:Uncharacterized protein n=1 Tax=Undibacterium terreum TaxID=1224302 RepID=A0A916V2I1_9BURK|nr:hypothetical protein [Undibacterium terreum]GGD01952.1 hypothetical protein GCM10011396_56880 [Undibacterium terreum]